MDYTNWRPTQGKPNMDTSDWRSQLQPESRQIIFNKIMETLKKNLPVAGPEGLQELWKIAVRFEENIYTAAASQVDYLREISLKMSTMETKSLPPGIAVSLLSNPGVSNQSSPDPGSIDSTAQTGQSYDWQEDVFQKIKAMKEMYLPELCELYQRINLKFQQPQDHTQQPKLDQFERYQFFKNLLERMITFLRVPKSNIIPVYRDKLALYEKQILHVLTTHRPKKPVSSQIQGQQHLQAPGLHPHSMQQQQQQPQSQLTQLQQHDNQMNPLMQPYELSVAKVEEGCQLTSVDDMADAVHYRLKIIEDEAA